MTSIIDRILLFIDEKNSNKRKFYIETGLSNGFLDKVKNIGSDKIEIILSTYVELNPIWLLTGEGNMLKGDEIKGISTFNEPITEYNKTPTRESYKKTVSLIKQLSANNDLSVIERQKLAEQIISDLVATHNLVGKYKKRVEETMEMIKKFMLED